MIIYGLFKILIYLFGFILSFLDSIPGFDAVNNAIQPYIDSLTNLIQSGLGFVSFFLPISLLKVLIPLVITIKLVVDNIDIFKFILKKTLGR